jgi:hypothetical protein
MSGDIIDQAQNAFNGKPNSPNLKAKKRYPTPVCVHYSNRTSRDSIINIGNQH